MREEFFASFVIMLPRIFAVQNDRQEYVILWRIERDLLDAAQDVVAGRVGRRFVVQKAEAIGQVPVAEHDRRLLARRAHAVGAIELGLPVPGYLRSLERAGKDAFIGGQPAEADATNHRNQFGTNRTL